MGNLYLSSIDFLDVPDTANDLTHKQAYAVVWWSYYNSSSAPAAFLGLMIVSCTSPVGGATTVLRYSECLDWFLRLFVYCPCPMDSKRPLRHGPRSKTTPAHGSRLTWSAVHVSVSRSVCFTPSNPHSHDDVIAYCAAYTVRAV